jgi:hypothetical protein
MPTNRSAAIAEVAGDAPLTAGEIADASSTPHIVNWLMGIRTHCLGDALCLWGIRRANSHSRSKEFQTVKGYTRAKHAPCHPRVIPSLRHPSYALIAPSLAERS